MIPSRLFELLVQASQHNKDLFDSSYSKVVRSNRISTESPPSTTSNVDWVTILEYVIQGDQAQFVHPVTKLTPLHLAVTLNNHSNDNSSRDATKIEVVKTLLEVFPKAASIQCVCRGFTPLMYSCIVQSENDIITTAAIVKLLLEHNPSCFHMISNEGQSALDIHIITMSRLQQRMNMEQQRIFSTDKSATRAKQFSNRFCAVIKALTEFQGAELCHLIPATLDLLYSCNALAIGELVSEEEEFEVMSMKPSKHRKGRSSNEAPRLFNENRVDACTLGRSTNLAHNYRGWLWECVLTVLRSYHAYSSQNKLVASVALPPFDAVHTASQIPDFPLVFTLLLLKAYPKQVSTRLRHQNARIQENNHNAARGDKTGGIGLPLHSVASWETTDDMVARKSMTLTQLLTEYPAGALVKNHNHQTPLSIALETGTSWYHGVRSLTSAQEK